MGMPIAQDAYRRGYAVAINGLSIVLGRLTPTITEMLADHADNSSLTEAERKQLVKARAELRNATKRLAAVAKSMNKSRYADHAPKKMKMRRSHEDG